MSEWKIIDGCPIDVPVLMFAPDTEYKGTNIYVASRQAYDNGTRFGITLVGSDCQTGCGNTGNPTYWMPLPAPPTNPGGGE